jgi:uncharacterized membrane protein YccF (DUF307 family)/ribosomal protein S27AE
MRTLGNILWYFPFFGFVDAILVYILGLILTITIIGAPLGLGLMELGKFLFAPFSYEMVSQKDLNIKQSKAWETYSTFVMIIYLPFGICLCLITVFQVGLLFLSIVGIPVALVLAKSLGTYFNPVNKKCVHRSVAQEIEKRKAQAYVSKAFEGRTASELSAKAGTPLERGKAFCSNCGGALATDDKFCPNCGQGAQQEVI